MGVYNMGKNHKKNAAKNTVAPVVNNNSVPTTEVPVTTTNTVPVSAPTVVVEVPVQVQPQVQVQAPQPVPAPAPAPVVPTVEAVVKAIATPAPVSEVPAVVQTPPVAPAPVAEVKKKGLFGKIRENVGAGLDAFRENKACHIAVVAGVEVLGLAVVGAAVAGPVGVGLTWLGHLGGSVTTAAAGVYVLPDVLKEHEGKLMTKLAKDGKLK